MASAINDGVGCPRGRLVRPVSVSLVTITGRASVSYLSRKRGETTF